jgi:hypothetical protein
MGEETPDEEDQVGRGRWLRKGCLINPERERWRKMSLMEKSREE